jgi:hypothetical protein
VVEGEHHRRRPVPEPEPELGKQVVDVRLDCSLADEQLGGDLAVGPAVADEHQHLTIEPRAAVRHHTHRPLQILGGHALEHEAGHAGAEHAGQHLIVVEGGERQHRRAALAAPHLSRGLHTVSHGHPRVHQDDDVGPQGLDGIGDLAAVGALPDDLEAERLSQYAPQPGPHQLLIIDKQNQANRVDGRPGGHHPDRVCQAVVQLRGRRVPPPSPGVQVARRIAVRGSEAAGVDGPHDRQQRHPGLEVAN